MGRSGAGADCACAGEAAAGAGGEAAQEEDPGPHRHRLRHRDGQYPPLEQTGLLTVVCYCNIGQKYTNIFLSLKNKNQILTTLTYDIIMI